MSIEAACFKRLVFLAAGGYRRYSNHKFGDTNQFSTVGGRMFLSYLAHKGSFLHKRRTYTPSVTISK